MKINETPENPRKSEKYDEVSDDKKPARNRAKVSIGAAGWPLRRLGIHIRNP